MLPGYKLLHLNMKWRKNKYKYGTEGELCGLRCVSSLSANYNSQ